MRLLCRRLAPTKHRTQDTHLAHPVCRNIANLVGMASFLQEVMKYPETGTVSETLLLLLSMGMHCL